MFPSSHGAVVYQSHDKGVDAKVHHLRLPGNVPGSQVLNRVDWLRLELAIIAAFHVIAGFTIGCAPRSQIVTAGTLPVFEMFPSLLTVDQARFWWAVSYTVAGAFAAVLLFRVTSAMQWITWLTVIPIGCTWVGTFSLAVLNGQGTALGVVVWMTLLLWWGTVAIRIALGGRGDVCGKA